mmetsp:Transcript_36634/g.91848  ORF Transcript_36634/g.91848 Transcript_36634/m.91848 type:complete len:238 (-) Transcript_36634:251-964(-)
MPPPAHQPDSQRMCRVTQGIHKAGVGLSSGADARRELQQHDAHAPHVKSPHGVAQRVGVVSLFGSMERCVCVGDLLPDLEKPRPVLAVRADAVQLHGRPKVRQPGLHVISLWSEKNVGPLDISVQYALGGAELKGLQNVEKSCLGQAHIANQLPEHPVCATEAHVFKSQPFAVRASARREQSYDGDVWRSVQLRVDAQLVQRHQVCLVHPVFENLKRNVLSDAFCLGACKVHCALIP